MSNHHNRHSNGNTNTGPTGNQANRPSSSNGNTQREPSNTAEGMLASAKSAVSQASDKAEGLLESAKASIAGGVKTVGDRIEKIGEKINEAGFKTVGNAVGKLGDKVEHFNDTAKK
jgi:hypothetical protein